MTLVYPHFQLPFAPVANPDVVVQQEKVRFTVLSSRLLRMEYDENGRFQDSPSQVFWYRNQSVPPFQVVRQGQHLEIITDHLHLVYTGGLFSPRSLAITLKESGTVWHYGDRDHQNLLGTARTLDGVSGTTHLDKGLMSRSGWAVVDDSKTLVFNEAGWLEPRAAITQDLYFFGYGHDYQGCLHDYCQVAGRVPMLPRWALGNWWSRYWAYTQEELTNLMTEFRNREVPLSVCIIDMDWHLDGWTGYTWNRQLFPDPDAFIAWLHEQGLRTALNLHPADGVGPHEEMYSEVAKRVGVDPETAEFVKLSLADPNYVSAYFELLHHPHEARGIDFWWMDWQQGRKSGIPGLDPLWWFNHYHFHDLGRDGQKRPFVFSRWGGFGNHRYPIGFSGDTEVDWPSLAFQPYFTATAANVGYGWWSHDIGGHMRGVEEPELYARWVQFGVFSPILRLHSGKTMFHERRPWGWDTETYLATRHAMQLRHALIPYLYTLSWCNYRDHLPPIRPMYHDYPTTEAAYHCPNQYTFGDDLIAAPFTTPANPDTRLSRQEVWLPEGEWYHFFTGEFLQGDRVVAVYGRLQDIPVFAKAGAIIPLGPMAGWGGVENPAELHLHIFAGQNGRFELFEDDGTTNNYVQGGYGLTAFSQTWKGNSLTVNISAVSGDATHVPDTRTYYLHLYGIHQPTNAEMQVAGSRWQVEHRYDSHKEVLEIGPVVVAKTAELTLTLSTNTSTLLSRRSRKRENLIAMLQTFKLATTTKGHIAHNLPTILNHPEFLAEYALSPAHRLALQDEINKS